MELLLIDDGNDLIVIAGQCGPQGQSAFAFSDFLGLRRVRATVLPEAIEGGGRSVALDEAARTDSPSAAQDELGGTIAATPLRGSPLRGSPLRGSPLRGSPLRGSPLRGSPLRGSPLTEVPLRGSGGWTAALEDTPLRGSPLQSITLGDVLDLDPIPDVALGDLDPTRGALRRTSVASLLLLGRPLDVLPLPSSAGWCAYLQGLGPTPRCDAPIDLTLHGLLDVELFGAEPARVLPRAADPAHRRRARHRRRWRPGRGRGAGRRRPRRHAAGPDQEQRRQRHLGLHDLHDDARRAAGNRPERVRRRHAGRPARGAAPVRRLRLHAPGAAAGHRPTRRAVARGGAGARRPHPSLDDERQPPRGRPHVRRRL